MNLTNLVATYFLFLICLNPLTAAPVITSVTPSNGSISGGNIITITGSGFSGATALDFGSRPATVFNVMTDTSISPVVPAGTAGTVDIKVTVASETSAINRADFYTYTESSWKGIISATSGDAVILFDTATNTINTSIPLPASSLSAIITPDGTTIYAADFNLASVNIIDVATNTITGNIPTPVAGTGAFDIIVSPDGKRIYISNISSGYVTAIDIITNTIIADVFVGVNLGPLSITPDGKTVYVSNFSFGNVTAIDTATNTIVTSILTGAIPGMIS